MPGEESDMLALLAGGFNGPCTLPVALTFKHCHSPGMPGEESGMSAQRAEGVMGPYTLPVALTFEACDP